MKVITKKHTYILGIVCIVLFGLAMTPMAISAQSVEFEGSGGTPDEDEGSEFDTDRDGTPPEYFFNGDYSRLQWFQLWSYKDTDVTSAYVEEFGITDQRLASTFIQDRLWQSPPNEVMGWNNANSLDTPYGGSDTSIYPEKANLNDDLGISDAHLTIHSKDPSTTVVDGDVETTYINTELLKINGVIDFREDEIDDDEFSSVTDVSASYSVEEIRIINDGEVIKTLDGTQRFSTTIVPEESPNEQEFKVEADIVGEISSSTIDDGNDDDNGGSVSPTPPPDCDSASRNCLSSGSGSSGSSGDGSDGGSSSPTPEPCGASETCLTNIQFSGFSSLGEPTQNIQQSARPPNTVTVTVSDSFTATTDTVDGFARVGITPDGNAKYYVVPQSRSPWNSVELPNGQTVGAGWQFYSHRDTGWDTITQHTTGEDAELLRDGIDNNEVYWATGTTVRPAVTKATPTDVKNQERYRTFEIGSYTSFEGETQTEVHPNIGFVNQDQPFERIYGMEIITNEPYQSGDILMNGFVDNVRGDVEVVEEVEIEESEMSVEVIEYHDDNTADIEVTLTDTDGNPINTGDRGSQSYIQVLNEEYNTGVDGKVIIEDVPQTPVLTIEHNPYPWWQEWPDSSGSSGGNELTPGGPTPPDLNKKFTSTSVSVDTIEGGASAFDTALYLLSIFIIVGLALFIAMKTMDKILGTSLWPPW